MPTGNPEPATESFATIRPEAGLLRLMFKPAIAWPAFKVSLVVGTVLNLINNGDKMWSHHGVSLWHAALNFVVPFLVSSYSAARNEAKRVGGQ